MLAITNRMAHKGVSAWGCDSKTIRQAFIVEADDVNKVKDNYGGYRQPGRMFTSGDVGRVVEVITDPKDAAYVSWYFGSVLPEAKGLKSLKDATKPLWLLKARRSTQDQDVIAIVDGDGMARSVTVIFNVGLNDAATTACIEFGHAAAELEVGAEMAREVKYHSLSLGSYTVTATARRLV